MTKFIKENFQIETGYKGVTSYLHNGKHEFIARHCVKGAKGFASFIMKNFTVEEYLGRLAAGEMPLTVVQSKGYVQPHVKKWMKAAGYTVFNQETQEHWFQNVYRKSFQKVA